MVPGNFYNTYNICLEIIDIWTLPSSRCQITPDSHAAKPTAHPTGYFWTRKRSSIHSLDDYKLLNFHFKFTCKSYGYSLVCRISNSCQSRGPTTMLISLWQMEMHSWLTPHNTLGSILISCQFCPGVNPLISVQLNMINMGVKWQPKQALGIRVSVEMQAGIVK